MESWAFRNSRQRASPQISPRRNYHHSSAHRRLFSVPPITISCVRKGAKALLSPTTTMDQTNNRHRIDKAFPGKHTERLYKERSKVEAGVLCKLRSGMCRFNGYLAKIRAVETNICECGRESESVDHFLFRCPQ